MTRMLLGLCLVLFTWCAAWTQPDAVQARLELVQRGATTLRESAATENLSFVQWDVPLALPGKNLQQKAASFLARHGAAFRVKEPLQHFIFSREQPDRAGGSHLTFQQYREGVPVFDGHLTFHFNAAHHLRAVGGVVVSDGDESLPAALLPEAVAHQQALTWMQREYPDVLPEQLEVTATLYWFREGLAQGLPGRTKLAYYVELTNRKNLRDYLFIDAAQGQVIEHFPGICTLAERHLYQGNAGNRIWQEGMSTDALTAWQKSQLNTSEETYAFFENNFGRRSYDDFDGEMHLIDKATFLSCPNASWNGFSTNYCDHLSTDDVVAHEWAHAYTEHTNHLLYAWQSGAINEAYSDIWGETLDLLNGDGQGDTLRTDCDHGHRWKIAEDATAFTGAIRDMWSPNCRQHPAATSDSLYFCASSDFGGVHKNSGVVNYAYALLVDGGIYKEQTIAGIGLTKAAHIFWHAQLHYLSRTSDFVVLADALEAACADLRDTPLPMLHIFAADTLAAPLWLTAADSLSLAQAIAATGLREQPTNCATFGPALQPTVPAFCMDADYVFHPFYAEDFEQANPAWQRDAVPVHPDSWVARTWQPVEELPRGRAGTAMFAASPAVGHCDTLKNNGSLRLQSPPIQVPIQVAGRIYLRFDHYFALEKNRDGGNLKLQRNGGSWRTVPTHAFLHNPYNAFFQPIGLFDNPLVGERVFTGADVGSVAGSWGTSLIDLTAAGVMAGDEVHLRWDLGTDGCNGWEGWYVDDIAVGTCMERALLPVEWLDFRVVREADRILLRWTTANERQNSGFTIERSTDGRAFHPIGWQAAGTATPFEQQYAFSDADWPKHSAHIYYRLRQVDTDGTYSYSAIRSVRIHEGGAVMAFPNPAKDWITLHGHTPLPASSVLSLRDMYGRLLLERPVAEGTTLSLQHLPAGVYFLSVTVDDQPHSVQRIVKE